MVMTAKVNKKKIAVILAAAAGLILAIALLLRGGSDVAETAASTVTGNDSRIAFLKEMGWEVTETPVQSGQVKIPNTSSEVFDRYNALQKSQNYDLSQYAGKTVMRYVYQVNNFPNATEPVYATLLVHKNQIIGGDITDTSAKGQIQGLQKPVVDATLTPTTEATAPTESTAA